MNNFEFQKASGVSDALQKVQATDASFVAGGTNLLDLWKYDISHPKALVHIGALEESKFISETEQGGVRLGAAVTNADTAYHPLIEERYPLLSKAILAGASAQIRNMATNGGNLLQRTRCYYFYDAELPCNKRKPGSGCPALKGHNRMHAILGGSEECIAVFPSDMCVALAALDATVNIQTQQDQGSFPFEHFHRLPGDTPQLDNNLPAGAIITSIDLPAKGFNTNYSYLKLRDRHSYAFALVSVATGLELEGNEIKDARIALGGVAPKPWRVKEAEESLIGKQANEESFSQAADIILRGAKGYRYNSFKIELAKQAVIRNCMMALDPKSQRPGAQPSL